MKKSKLLIPAVGFLMISLAAAGTSTVAWFTSTTAATATLGNLFASKVDGNLKIWSTVDAALTTPIVGASYAVTTEEVQTEASAGVSTAATIMTGAKLRDSSVSMAATGTSHDCFIPKDYATSTPYAPTSFKLTTTTNGSYYSGEATAAIYNYARYTLHFSTGAISAQAVYFAALGSSFTSTSTTFNPSIRIGFDRGSIGAPTIWAPNNSTVISGDGNNGISYIKTAGTFDAATSYGYYKESAINTTNANTFIVGSADSTEKHSAINYLGDVIFGTNLSVTVYIWFEGSDGACVDANLTSGVSGEFSGTMNFYSVEKAV